MNVDAWNLITLDAKKILCNLTERNIVPKNDNYEIQFRYELFNNMDRDIISSEDVFRDNALFFQLRKTLPAGTQIDENALKNFIVFVDFKDIFWEHNFSEIPETSETLARNELMSDKSLAYRLSRLFQDGLYLNFDGKIFKKFVPFDKSSSMARNCQITFIDSQIKKFIDKRLMLDMDFIGQPLELSKFYAYRGLYLSAAFRIDNSPQFLLNEESVVVLPDYNTKLTQTVFTATKNDSENLWEYKFQDKNLTIKIFDGEGLISPDFAEYISNFLQTQKNFNSVSHSFQIRMPFIKGVLHEVDFEKFFSENLQTVPEELLIKDIFGITRNLRNAKIILTESMFKCAKWIKDQPTAADPMKYFFEKFATYEHALYVTNTEARLSNTGCVRLNYQFLSTLDLNLEEFNAIVEDQLKKIYSLKDTFAATYNEFFAEQLNADEEISDSTETDTLNIANSTSRLACLKALSKNPAFINDPKVKMIYEDTLKNYQCNLGLGRLEVQGEQRFLSCDLAFLLIEILSHIENVQFEDSDKIHLENQCLYKDRFFMPVSKIPIIPDKHYVFLRNPHLSRNEQVILKAYVKKNSLYEKYFSHLKGVVMISAKSTAAMSLGGADFDGDLVKIVSDSSIIQAVKRVNFDTLPPIEIPPANSPRQPLGYSIPVSVIVNTFSGKVGMISNLAVKLAKKEYFSQTADENFQNVCAKCTIVVGLEIDAAKTGVHPNKNIQALQDLARACNDGRNIFLDSKEKIQQILRGHYSPIVKSKGENFYLYFSAEAAKHSSSSLIVPFEKGESSILERLPARYLNLVATGDLPSLTQTISSDAKCFEFENQGWRGNLDKDKQERLRLLVKAYLRILSLDRKRRYLKNFFRQKTFGGHIINILKLQYDDLNQKLPCGMEVSEALDQIYPELLSIVNNSESAKKALDSLKVFKWHLVEENLRPLVAAKILDFKLSENENLPATFELLYNFRCNGFMIFYYILKELQGRLFEISDVILSDEDSAQFENNPYYDEFQKIYSMNITEKRNKSIWNAQIVQICRNRLSEIFEGNMSDALKYFWARKSEDKQRTFFWNVFTEKEILSAIKM